MGSVTGDDGRPRTNDGRVAGTVDPEGAAMLLGDDGLSVLRAIVHGASDPWVIHARTGVPVSCIEERVRILKQFNMVNASARGTVSITPLGLHAVNESS